jgi:hypothetical protein
MVREVALGFSGQRRNELQQSKNVTPFYRDKGDYRFRRSDHGGLGQERQEKESKFKVTTKLTLKSIL